MNRHTFLCGAAVSAAAIAPALAENSAAVAVPRSVAGIAIPESQLAREATEAARTVEPPHLFLHSLRSFVFGELFANAKGIKHDSEVVYVSAVLHDIGLTPEHATPHQRFEVDGANLERDLVTKHAKPDDDGYIAWEAVAMHSLYGYARFMKPEVNVLSAGVVTDVGAAFAPQLERSAIEQVLRAFPRRGFNDAFVSILADYAKRKPDTVGGTFIEGVAIRTLPDYKPGNFYDAMKSGDAFAQMGFTI